MSSLSNFVAASSILAIVVVAVVSALPRDGTYQTTKEGHHACEISERAHDRAHKLVAFQECALLFKPLFQKEKDTPLNTTDSQDILLQELQELAAQHQKKRAQLRQQAGAGFPPQFNLSDIEAHLNAFQDELAANMLSKLNASQTKELFPGGKIKRSKHFPCMTACMMSRMHIFDNTGKVNETAVAEYFAHRTNSTIAPEMTERIVQNCYERSQFNGTHILSPQGSEKIKLDYTVFSSPSCRTVTAFTMCITRSTHELCKYLSGGAFPGRN